MSLTLEVKTCPVCYVQQFPLCVARSLLTLADGILLVSQWSNCKFPILYRDVHCEIRASPIDFHLLLSCVIWIYCLHPSFSCLPPSPGHLLFAALSVGSHCVVHVVHLLPVHGITGLAEVQFSLLIWAIMSLALVFALIRGAHLVSLWTSEKWQCYNCT